METHIDETKTFGQCRQMKIPHHDILLHGHGNSAKVTALSLVAAGFRVAMAMPPPAKTVENADDWQAVLALSPSAKRMLETLGVWSALDQPSAPVHDMTVYGCADDVSATLLPARLGFGDPTAPAILAHIVSLASLGRALSKACAHAIDEGRLTQLGAPIVDFDTSTRTAQLADSTKGGTQCTTDLLVDTQRIGGGIGGTAPPWRHRQAARPLRHNYQASALIGRVISDRPHADTAHQLFLPSGPLALLPLPDPHIMAMVWTLPHARAQALARADTHVRAHELAQATQNQFGTLTAPDPLGVQPLQLHLAEDFVDGSIVLVGEAAHIVHPLAGQGFNLTLRDSATLADILYEGRALGLAIGERTMLAHYATARRSDAAMVAATTHGLAQGFGNSRAGMGRLGLTAMQILARQWPSLRTRLTAQADAGLGADVARLMRGEAYPSRPL